MRIKTFLLTLIALFFISSHSYADAPLKSALGLSMGQAKAVSEIQKRARKPYRSKRGDYNREARKLRRARNANDSALVAKQERITEKLRAEVRQLKLAEDQAIRNVLTSEQRVKFEAYIEERRAMAGGSRDAKIFGF